MLIKAVILSVLILILATAILFLITANNYVSYSIDSANRCQWKEGKKTGLTTLVGSFSTERKLMLKKEEDSFINESQSKGRCATKENFFGTYTFVIRNKLGLVTQNLQE